MSEVAQWYPPGPYEYTRDWDFLVDFSTDTDAYRSALPSALTPEENSRAWLRVSCHKTSSFGPYIGAYIGLYAEYQGAPVRYTVSGLKTDFMGTIAAREIWGLPYGLGRVEAGWAGSLFRCDIFGYTNEALASVKLQTTSRRTAEHKAYAACYTADLRDHTGNVLKTQLLKAQNAYSLGEADTWDAVATLALHQGTALNDWSLIPVVDVLHAEYRTGGKSSLGMAQVLTEW